MERNKARFFTTTYKLETIEKRLAPFVSSDATPSMAAIPSCTPSHPPHHRHHYPLPSSLLRLPIFALLLFASFSLLCLALFLHRKRKKTTATPEPPSLSAVLRISQRLVVEVLTSDDNSFGSGLRLLPSPEAGEEGGGGRGEGGEKCESLNGSEVDTGEECERGEEEAAGRKKKRRARRKRRGEAKSGMEAGAGAATKESGDWLYPFTSLASVTQRKIKQQYDQLVKSNDNKALTLAQVGKFANFLIDAKSNLQHKSEIIQRKFTITNALLLKADRSSFDRLCQQIYRLEAEQKRLEEDTLVYNRLQEQLKLSPAYKKMLEVASQMESQPDSRQSEEYSDSDISDISFEELLAQEKKDSFWQKNGKLRSCSK